MIVCLITDFVVKIVFVTNKEDYLDVMSQTDLWPWRLFSEEV